MADSLINDDQINGNDREDILNKWKDKPQEELLKAKVESDLYIKTLTARMDDLTKDHLKLMEDSKAKAQLQDLIDRLEKPASNVDTNPDTNKGNVDQPTIKPEDIEKLLETKLAQHDQGKKWDENFNMIKAKLKEQLGDNYSETFKQRRDNLGLTQEFADELARKYPDLFIKSFLGEARSSDFSPPPRSGTRPASFSPQTPKRDWNYYQALKKENPRLYLDPKIAVQMHDDAIALGDAFGMPTD